MLSQSMNEDDRATPQSVQSRVAASFFFTKVNLVLRTERTLQDLLIVEMREPFNALAYGDATDTLIVSDTVSSNGKPALSFLSQICFRIQEKGAKEDRERK